MPKTKPEKVDMLIKFIGINVKRQTSRSKIWENWILIVNLGTPDLTKWWDIRKYLKEFLSDKRVIEFNPILWQIILNLFILTFRPSKTAHAYKKIWRKEKRVTIVIFYKKSSK